MLIRQKIQLHLLQAANGGMTKAQLVEQSFCLSSFGHSPKLKTFYQFVNFNGHAWSFTQERELDNLVRSGHLSSSEPNYFQLTAVGDNALEEPLDLSIREDLQTLKRHLANSAHKQSSLAFGAPLTNDSPCPLANFTIGYQSVQVEGLLNRLLEAKIERLLDTRKNPISRRFGFYKSTLARLCEAVGVQYEHLPALGIPSGWRQNLDSEGARQFLFDKYETDILQNEGELLKNISANIQHTRTAIMCREVDRAQCHRSRLAAHLSALNGLPVIELHFVHRFL